MELLWDCQTFGPTVNETKSRYVVTLIVILEDLAGSLHLLFI